MPFIKGQSGNPSGKNGKKPISDALKALLSRKPGKTIDASGCETNAHVIALNLMTKALGGDKDAIKEVLDRTEGRPSQAITGADDGPIEVALDESALARRIAYVLAKASPNNQ